MKAHVPYFGGSGEEKNTGNSECASHGLRLGAEAEAVMTHEPVIK